MEQKTLLVSKWGNSAGVLVPRAWLGQEVKVTLVDRTLQIKKEVFEILKNYSEELVGVYLVGSYARGDYTKDSDVDVIAVSKNISKEIISGKYHISVYSVEVLKKILKENPILLYPRLAEAKVLFNGFFLENLDFNYNKKDFSKFISDTKRVIKINKKILEIEKSEGEFLKSVEIIYSLILRLRGIFILDCLFSKKKYSKKLFKSWMLKNIKGLDFDFVYGIYEEVKKGENVKEKLNFEIPMQLLKLLEKEVKKYGK